MRMKKITVILLIPILACCQTMKPDKYKKTQIIFGSGGGFTNLRNEYHLLDNGRLFHKTNFDTTYTEIKLPKDFKAQPYFDEAHAIFDTLEESGEPSNMYYFLKFQEGENFKEVVWGSGKIPKKSKVLYKKLIQLTEK